MQPINYLLNNQNPLDALLGGVSQYQNMRQNDNVLAQQQEASRIAQAQNDQKIQAMTDAQGLDFGNPDMVRQYLAKYAHLESSKGIKSYVDGLNEKEQQSFLADTSKAISLLRGGDNASAAKLAKEKAMAYKNAGDTAKAAEYEQIASMMETHPTAMLQSLQMSYAVAAGKDNMAAYKDYIEANAPKVKEMDAGGELGGYVIDPVTGETTYQKFVDKSVSPDKQLDADTSMYVSDNSLTGTKYSADSSRQASMYSSDNSLKGSMYNADVGYQGKVLDNQHQDARSQAQLLMEAQKARIEQQKGQMVTGSDGLAYVFYPSLGKYEPLLGADGRQMAGQAQAGASSKNSPQQEAKRISELSGLISEAQQLLRSPDATGSGFGSLVDKGAGFFGVSTSGSQVTSRLKTIAGQLTSKMPRMEGPQSDKDVEMYKQMAGDVANDSLPIANRLAALDTMAKLNAKYANIQAGQGNSSNGGFNMSNHFTGN